MISSEDKSLPMRQKLTRISDALTLDVIALLFAPVARITQHLGPAPMGAGDASQTSLAV